MTKIEKATEAAKAYNAAACAAGTSRRAHVETDGSILLHTPKSLSGREWVTARRIEKDAEEFRAMAAKRA